MIATFAPSRRWSLLALLLLVGLNAIGLTDARTKVSEEQASAGSTRAPTPKEIGATTRGGNTSETREVRHGADPKTNPTDSNPPTQSITVTILDAGSGKPVVDAEISAPPIDWRKPQPRRLTDSNGQYILQMPVPSKEVRNRVANFNISVRHSEYAPRAAAWTSSAGDVYGVIPSEVSIKLEKGISIGGIVRDSRDTPLAGIRVLLSGSGYRGFTMGTGEQKSHEYPEIWSLDEKEPASVTDTSGKWSYLHFPTDLPSVEVTLVRPDGSRQSFATFQEPGINQREPVNLEDLKTQQAVLILKDGFTVRGIVVDDAGRPIPAATVKEGYGHGNIQRISEIATDAEGRFERSNRVARQWIYTASAPGRATVSAIAQVEAGMPDVRLVLPPAQPLRVRIADEEGNPVSDAELTLDNFRNEAQLLDWSARADSDGRAVWTNAPNQLVRFYANSKKLGASRLFKVLADGSEKVFVLSKEASQRARVQIKASDTRTSAPIAISSISAEYNGNFAFKRLARPMTNESSVEIRMTDFQVGMMPSYKLKVEAEGYEPVVTDFIDLAEGDQTLELKLSPGSLAKCVLLLPNGEPAAQATVWSVQPDTGLALFCNQPGRYYGDRLAKTQSDAQGRFEVPSTSENIMAIVTHPMGFLQMPLSELKAQPELRLQPWGRIEGQLKIAGEPKAQIRVNLASLSFDSTKGFNLIYNTTTTTNGSFLFTNVPTGDYKIYRQMTVRMGRSITEDHAMPVSVKSGETLKVDYTGSGRPVIGQAVADQPELEVNWLNDDHVLVLKLPSVSLAPVNREDFATFKAFLKANNDSRHSPQRLENARLARTYLLNFESDGSFRVEDVPPATYELRIRVTKPTDGQRFTGFQRPEDELGSLVREIVVPSGDGPFDVGKVTVLIRGETVEKRLPLHLEAQTLDGKPLNLDEFKGRYVLLAFWAAWSERSLEQLENLQRLNSQFRDDRRLALVGISIDQDAAAARKIAKERGFNWKQGWLDDNQRAKVTEAFDINNLPAIFLVDPKTRIVNRDLEGDRIRVAVERVLQKN